MVQCCKGLRFCGGRASPHGISIACGKGEGAGLLESGVSCKDMDAPIFEKYWHRIASDFGLPHNTLADKEATWSQLLCLPTFEKKASLPKLGRWFSWNCVAHEQLPEYSALQMLLEHHFGTEPTDSADEEGGESIAAAAHDDPRQELATLRASAGGLKLAASLMSDAALLQNAKILFTVTRPLWGWYTAQVRRVKGPRHAFKYDMHMAESWSADSRSTVRVLLEEGALQSMGLLPGDAEAPASVSDNAFHDSLASRAHALVWHIAANRCWSLSKHSCPPYSCALLGASSDAVSAAAAQRASKEWGHLLRLEQMAAAGGEAKQLRGDIHWADSQAIRLLYCFFERDRWAVGSVCGQKWLRGLLMRLPDNKIVEDIHAAIRNASRSNPNRKLTVLNMQELIAHSKVLESRDVRHSTAVCRDTFKAQLGSTRVRRLGWRSNASSHKMPASWSALMGRRTWASPTPEAAHRATAAWQWLHTYLSRPAAADPLPISHGWLSSLLRPFTVVAGHGQLFASLGNARWAALVWPLRRLAIPGGSAEAELLQWDGSDNASAQWLHITDLKDWHVLPVQVVSPLAARSTYPSLGQEGRSILLRVIGAPIALLNYFFREKTCLSHADLLRLARDLELGDYPSSTARQVLIQAIAAHAAADSSPEEQAAFIQAALQLDSARQADMKDDIAEDPLCEQAYEELDPDDQLEFQDLKESFKKQKARNRLAAWRAAQDKALERDGARRKAKAKRRKGKAKAKARAKKRRRAVGQFARAAKAARLAAAAAQPPLQLLPAAAAAELDEPLPPLAGGEPAVGGHAEPPAADAAGSAAELGEPLQSPPLAGGEPPPAGHAEPIAADAVGSAEEDAAATSAAAAAPQDATAAALMEPLQPPPLFGDAPPAAGHADPMPVEEAAPAVAAAAAARRPEAEQARAVGGRGPNLDANLTWTSVACDQCGQEAIGQYKLDPCPGGRAPVWIMRVRDGSTWPSQGPFFRVRRTSVVGESHSFSRNWIQQNRKCCGTPA